MAQWPARIAAAPDVGAIVGASVGAVVGFFHGLHWSRGTSVAACMQSKGYRRI